jgi:hypothetical protein
MSSIPEIIRQQITVGVLMSLGASDLMSDRVHAAKGEPSDSLTFKARILTKPRGAVRIMRVTVTLDPSDTYSIKVGYFKARRNAPGAHGWAPSEWITHFSAEDVYNDSLARTLLSLDNVI